MSTDALRPVLVGGTGRSGSTIVGHLLDHHPSLTLSRPMEVRFIAGNKGIADALAVAGSDADKGRAAARQAVERLQSRWFERAETVGLHQSMSRHELNDLCAAYLEGFQDDPLGASRTITYAVMDRVAARLGASRLVDTTPANARQADKLEPIYPESLVVEVTRDGRDVSASFVSQSFGPDDVFEALAQWEARMRKAHRAKMASRAGRVLSLELMDLVVRDRDATLERLCEFLGVDVDDSLVEWFDANVTAEGMHPGRWRRDFDEQECGRIDSTYDEICSRLTAEGVVIPTP